MNVPEEVFSLFEVAVSTSTKYVLESVSGLKDKIKLVVNGSVRRKINIDHQRNCIVMYTKDKTIYSDPQIQENREKVMWLVTYINEGLSLTGLEYSLTKGKFRYKSSQSFPKKTINPTEVISLFHDLHDFHFPLLIICINEFISKKQDPYEASREFLRQINVR